MQISFRCFIRAAYTAGTEFVSQPMQAIDFPGSICLPDFALYGYFCGTSHGIN